MAYYCPETARRWIEINPKLAALIAKLPKAWAAKLRGQVAAIDEAEQWLRRKNEKLESLITGFADMHGDALGWMLGSVDAKDLADKCAALVSDIYLQIHQLHGVEGLGTLGAQALELLRWDAVCKFFAAIKIDLPKAKTLAGGLARAECRYWWRRAVRTKQARSVELGAIKLGLVNKNRGAYCSGQTLQARAWQLENNAKMLANTLIKNEAGQVFTLAKLAALSTANPDIRRGELMTRIRGCEDYAAKHGHSGLFLTLTAPSKFHAQTLKGYKSVANPKYNGASPKDAQAWLCQTWARVRAALARAGIAYYGLRVVEPHHDACPHWHMMLFIQGGGQAVQELQKIVREYWLAEDGGEAGAAKHRCTFKKISHNGAAAYVAKYIAKSVGGAVDVGAHFDDVDGQRVEVERGKQTTGASRVDAWAACWGIRQFQFLGTPSVGLWRAFRRVSADQIPDMMAEVADKHAKAAWYACHKWDYIDVQADYCRFMEQAGGAACPRAKQRFRLAINRQPSAGHFNSYGEAVKKREVIGVELLSGYWLVAKRIYWKAVAGGTERETSHEENARLAAPWSGFNNCTARLTGKMRDLLLPSQARERQARIDDEKRMRLINFHDKYEELRAISKMAA